MLVQDTLSYSNVRDPNHVSFKPLAVDSNFKIDAMLLTKIIRNDGADEFHMGMNTVRFTSSYKPRNRSATPRRFPDRYT